MRFRLFFFGILDEICKKWKWSCSSWIEMCFVTLKFVIEFGGNVWLSGRKDAIFSDLNQLVNFSIPKNFRFSSWLFQPRSTRSEKPIGRSWKHAFWLRSLESFHSRRHFDWMPLNTPMNPSFTRNYWQNAYEGRSREGKLGESLCLCPVRRPRASQSISKNNSWVKQIKNEIKDIAK